MIKIVLYLDHKVDGISPEQQQFRYFREAARPGIYLNATNGTFVDLDSHHLGIIDSIRIDEATNTRYLYILAENEAEFEEVLSNDARWQFANDHP